MSHTMLDSHPASVLPTGDDSCLMTNLGWLLGHASHVLATEMALALAPLDLGSRRFCVLTTAAGRELTQKDLATEIGIDKTTLVVTLDELERDGLAERRTSSTDRRARVISVTRAGLAKIAEGQAIVDRVQRDVLSALPDGERDAFLAALQRLARDRLAEAPACAMAPRRREPRAA
jgi:MarR family transcriptional regulator, transcriptional regulator for hemolysin